MPPPTNLDPESLALYLDLVSRARVALATTINELAEQIKDRSLIEVPKSGNHQETERVPIALEESVFIEHATPEELQAVVGYDHPAAAAQEVGRMVRHTRSGELSEWEATHYTTEGTKSHYLEDALKSVVPEAEIILGENAQLAFSAKVDPQLLAIKAQVLSGRS